MYRSSELYDSARLMIYCNFGSRFQGWGGRVGCRQPDTEISLLFHVLHVQYRRTKNSGYLTQQEIYKHKSSNFRHLKVIFLVLHKKKCCGLISLVTKHQPTHAHVWMCTNHNDIAKSYTYGLVRVC